MVYVTSQSCPCNTAAYTMLQQTQCPSHYATMLSQRCHPSTVITSMSFQCCCHNAEITLQCYHHNTICCNNNINVTMLLHTQCHHHKATIPVILLQCHQEYNPTYTMMPMAMPPSKTSTTSGHLKNAISMLISHQHDSLTRLSSQSSHCNAAVLLLFVASSRHF